MRTSALVALLTTCLALGCGGGESGTSPTPAPIAAQGMVTLAGFQMAVVSFRVDREGTLSSRADWGSAANDVDTSIVRGRCTVDQILEQAAGCTEASLAASESSTAKPSTLSASVQPGDYTLVIFNWGPSSDSISYRLDGFVSNASAPTTSAVISTPTPPPAPTPAPGRRTERFLFTLTAGSTASVVLGPVRAASGPVEVTLDYAGDFRILACAGTASRCTPFGGRPASRTFTIPTDFPAGPVQVGVYFNRALMQPPGNASGTVTMSYSPA